MRAAVRTKRKYKYESAIVGLFTLAVSIACFLIGAATARAQLPTATILGVVTDKSGAVVPEVTVTARDVDTGQTRTTTTAGDGSYRLPALLVGNYEVTAEHPGFEKDVRTGLTLTVSQEAVVNFSLQVGAVSQTVAVTEEAPLVNTTSAALGGLVNEQRVENLPLNGRNYIDLTLLQPGVVQTQNITPTGSTVGVWFSSNGAPLRSNHYLLDGTSMVNMAGGTPGTVTGATLGVEGIREFRVVTNASSAEYGMTMGSQVLLVSKSGTNSFHGSLFEFLRNSALDARNFFDQITPATPRRLPAYERNDFGGSFGGPIKKDKTFFYAVLEVLRDRTGLTTVDNVIPTADKANGGLVPQISPAVQPWLSLFPAPNLPNNQYTFPFNEPTSDNWGQIRVDHTFSAKDNLFGRYTIDDADQNRPGGYPQLSQNAGSRGQFITLAENHIFSPTILNVFRISFSRTHSDFVTPPDPAITGPQFSFVPGLEMGTLTIGGVTSFGPPTPQVQTQNVWAFSDDLFYTKGRHSLKFGVLWNRYTQFTIQNVDLFGGITFANIQQFLLGEAENYSAVTPGSSQEVNFHFDTIGNYAQDDVRLTNRLTLNLGLRYEFATTPVEQSGHSAALRNIETDAEPTIGPPFINPSLHNFSPRVGFAWDVFGNGKTAVRGGFAELFDLGNLGAALIQGATGTPPFSSQSEVVSPATLTLPLFFPASSAGKVIRPVDYHLQQPHMLQYNFAVEQQFPSHMALTVAYAGSRGFHLMQIKEGNPVVPQVLPDGQFFWTANRSRINPNWGSITLETADGNSWYNSLQLGLTERLTKGLQFQASYTYSKLLDETQGQFNADTTSSSIFGTAPLDEVLDRGPAAFDATQVFHFNAIYHFPQVTTFGKFARGLLNGWWASGIVTAQTGFPFTVSLNSNRSLSQVDGGAAGIDRPNLLPGRTNGNITSGFSTGCDGVAAGTPLGTPNLYYDPCAFAIQPAGFLGTAGRDILRAPGLNNLDFSAVKDTPLRYLGEAGTVEFRAEFFNALNQVNFGLPGLNVFAAVQSVEPPLATAGKITQTIGTSRQIQFALKLMF